MQFSVEVKVPFTSLVSVLSSSGKAVVPGFAEVSSTRWRADPEWTAAISFWAEVFIYFCSSVTDTKNAYLFSKKSFSHPM